MASVQMGILSEPLPFESDCPTLLQSDRARLRVLTPPPIPVQLSV
jgi:hypothetical protein